MIFLRHKAHCRQARSIHSTSDRRISLNERLASIGGLFGALSIIITGALLYAIFTARTEDKWYYISAVLINVSLLVILMSSAIVFDRYYLRKLTSTSSTFNSNSTTSAIGNTTYHGTSIASNVEMSSFTNYGQSASDGPPQYPGYFPQPQLQQMPNTQTTAAVVLFTPTIVCDNQNENTHIADLSVVSEASGIDDEKSKSYRPPSYYELYPQTKPTEAAQLQNEPANAAKMKPNEISSQLNDVSVNSNNSVLENNGESQ